jgi:hypothetical protein
MPSHLTCGRRAVRAADCGRRPSRPGPARTVSRRVAVRAGRVNRARSADRHPAGPSRAGARPGRHIFQRDCTGQGRPGRRPAPRPAPPLMGLDAPYLTTLDPHEEGHTRSGIPPLVFRSSSSWASVWGVYGQRACLGAACAAVSGRGSRDGGLRGSVSPSLMRRDGSREAIPGPRRSRRAGNATRRDGAGRALSRRRFRRAAPAALAAPAQRQPRECCAGGRKRLRSEH